jgi:hypothetical protein
MEKMINLKMEDIKGLDDSLTTKSKSTSSSFNLLYFETDGKDIVDYYNKLLSFIQYINLYQEHGGTSIIKIDGLFHKCILDLVYLLTSMFDNVYVVKTNVSFIFNNERFLICKHFSNKIEVEDEVEHTYDNDVQELPIYFLNKIEDSNIIIGNSQLEYYDLLINTLKHRNQDDKLDKIKKSNIQKCIQWCEKNKVPNNKFVDKLNIFLPLETSNESIQ